MPLNVAVGFPPHFVGRRVNCQSPEHSTTPRLPAGWMFESRLGIRLLLYPDRPIG